MPRQPRYFIPGFPQHVVQRGVDRQAVFFRPEDYERYLDAMSEGAAEHGCDVHAYVLMTNHVHLLVTPRSERALPLLMQAMGRKYVQALNRRYRRTGTLRIDSIIVPENASASEHHTKSSSVRKTS